MLTLNRVVRWPDHLAERGRRPQCRHRRQRLGRAVQRQRRHRGACGGQPAREQRHGADVPRAGKDHQHARPEITGTRGGIHNSVTRIVLKPTHMIGGYAQYSYGFNYYGTIGTNRDEFVVVRKMNRVDWLDEPAGRNVPRLSSPQEGEHDENSRTIGMVLNLDKCIGCHTCSVTCKNVWTSRPGVEYAWFNNVETKPGIGYPKEWENQDKWNGGWSRNADGSIVPRQGGKWKMLMRIFANPEPAADRRLLRALHVRLRPPAVGARNEGAAHGPPAQPDHRSAHEKIEWGPNWEEILGGEFSKRSKDKNFDDVQKDIYGQFENTFMMYLPRLCEHCLNPACVASCPSGSIYKREEDGIVLIDQDKCRGWRMCISGCPYKKISTTGRPARPRSASSAIRASKPASLRCVRKPAWAVSVTWACCCTTQTASRKQPAWSVTATCTRRSSTSSSTRTTPRSSKQARIDGIPDNWMDAARNSPVYKMAVEWKVALPLHPEYRTLPMVWYVPPLSPITAAANAGQVSANGEIPDVSQLRIPVQYLANLLTAGDTAPVVRALERMLAMRTYQREKHVEQRQNLSVLKQVGLTLNEAEDMYQIMAIANYEDRFVIPSTHREYAENAFDIRAAAGFRLAMVARTAPARSACSVARSRAPFRSRLPSKEPPCSEETGVPASDAAGAGTFAELPRRAVAFGNAATGRSLAGGTGTQGRSPRRTGGAVPPAGGVRSDGGRVPLCRDVRPWPFVVAAPV